MPVSAGLSFEVDFGEAVAVVGSNGSGESTLLKCLVGAETHDEGEVLLGGAPFDESSSFVRAACASLLDNDDYFPDVSVLNGVISAVGVVAVVYQIATRPPIDHGTAVVDFGLFGPTPLGQQASGRPTPSPSSCRICALCSRRDPWSCCTTRKSRR